MKKLIPLFILIFIVLGCQPKVEKDVRQTDEQAMPAKAAPRLGMTEKEFLALCAPAKYESVDGEINGKFRKVKTPDENSEPRSDCDGAFVFDNDKLTQIIPR